MEGRYILNGKDMWLLFGVVIGSGSGSFLVYPERKDSLTNDYMDQDGIQIDLLDPKYKSREFNLFCQLIANGRDDFWTKYNGLFTEISSAGTHVIYIADLGKTFHCYYKRQENLSKLTPLDSGQVGVTFNLVFGETTPTENMEAVYLVDDQDNYLIA